MLTFEFLRLLQHGFRLLHLIILQVHIWPLLLRVQSILVKVKVFHVVLLVALDEIYKLVLLTDPVLESV